METWEKRLQREQEERTKSRIAFDAKAHAIAKALGAEYQPNDNSDSAWDKGSGKIHHADYSLFIDMSPRSKDDRINVSGRYPPADNGMNRIMRDVLSYDERSKSAPVDHMTCAASKSAEKIAKEIERRILSAVLDYTQRFKALDSRNRDNANKRDAFIQAIRDRVVGCSVWVSGRNRQELPLASDYVELQVPLSADRSMHMTVSPGGNAQIRQFYVDSDEALRIIDALAKTAA